MRKETREGRQKTQSLTSNASDLDKAKDIAYRYISYRPRSILEVVNKLKEKGFDAKTTEETVARLKELNYLDDRDFACRVAREMAKGRGYGRYYISNKLGEKGIDKETVIFVLDEVFSELDETELARKSALKKINIACSDMRVEKARISRYLQRRGFSWGIINDVLKEIDDRERDQK